MQNYVQKVFRNLYHVASFCEARSEITDTKVGETGGETRSLGRGSWNSVGGKTLFLPGIKESGITESAPVISGLKM